MRKSLLLSIPMLALSLVACSGGSGDGPPKGEPIAKVAAPAGKQWTDTVVKTEEGYKSRQSRRRNCNWSNMVQSLAPAALPFRSSRTPS